MAPAIEEIGAREGLSVRQQEWEKKGCKERAQINRKAREDCLENPDLLFSQI